jgi:hypothetical protein
MFCSRDGQAGSGSVIPSEPLVIPEKFTAHTCRPSSSAIVMITNAWPRARSTTAPTPTAVAVATRPPSGTRYSGLTPQRSERMPAV